MKINCNYALVFFLFTFSFLTAQEVNTVSGNGYTTVNDIAYYYEEYTKDAYVIERCKLDLYYPEDSENFSTIVWFHGGGLRAGNKSIPEQLKKQGIAIAAVNYRLYPKVKCPEYIRDAAAATAWIMKNISKYGGDTNAVFASGHSAGGYLTSMIGLDKKWLNEFGVDADRLAGLIPFSGHTITHFTVREERGIPGEQPIIDEYAPLFYVRNDAPPLILITGDRNLEMLGRYEENAYMYRMMKVVGHKSTEIFEIQGFDHGGMAVPAYSILLGKIKMLTGEKSGM